MNLSLTSAFRASVRPPINNPTSMASRRKIWAPPVLPETPKLPGDWKRSHAGNETLNKTQVAFTSNACAPF